MRLTERRDAPGPPDRLSARDTTVRLSRGLVLLALAVAAVGCSPALDLASHQERVSRLTAPLQAGACSGGLFTAGRDGLSALELWMDGRGDTVFPVHLYAAGTDRPLASGTVTTETGWARFTFPRVPDSGGRSFALCVEATGPDARLGYAHDLTRADQPRFENGRPGSGALTLRAFYEATPADIVLAAWQAARRLPLAATLALLFGLGLPLGLLATGGDRRPIDVLAAAPGLGLLTVAVLWWVTAPLGAAASTGATLVVAVLGWIALAVTSARRAAADSSDHEHQVDAPLAPVVLGGLLVVVVGAAIALRLALIVDLSLPVWVDAIHHTYLIALLAARGIPTDYGPLLEFGPFTYHFGLHAAGATIARLTNADPADSLLLLGQALAALSTLAAYSVVRSLGGTVGGGVIAAAIAGLVSILPAYYVSWSRYTHLAGMIAGASLLWLLSRGISSRSRAIALGLGLAGLPMVHPRLAVLTLLAGLVMVLLSGQVWRVVSHRREAILVAATAAAVGAGWVARVATSLVGRISGGGDEVATANAINLTVIETGHDRVLYLGALGAAALAIALCWRVGVGILLWACAALVASDPGRFGLPGGYLIGTPALVITLWLPMAAILGFAIGDLVQRVRPAWPALAWRGPAVAAAGCAIALALSGPAYATLNAVTVRSTPSDRLALDRAAAHLRPGDTVIVNGFLWQFGTYAGADAGAWIGVRTPGRAIVPPAIHGLAPPEQARAIAAVTREAVDASGDAERLVAFARARGLRWIFVGERGGAIDAAALEAHPMVRLVERVGGARLFRIEGG